MLALPGTTWITTGDKEGPTYCSPKVPINSLDLGILLFSLLPHHPKHTGQSQGHT